MSPRTRSLVPTAWLRLPPRTARLRLTLMYSSLFLLLGTALLAATYLLTTGSTSISVAHAVRQSFATPASGAVAVVPVPANGSVPPALAQGLVAQHNADLGRLLGVSWVVLLVTTFGSAILGWFVAGRVLRPLREITDTARTISAGNLHERLALAGPNDEFKRLGDTLDDLLARLEASFEAQRRFVANASHELRTPLTVERTLLQVALANPNATEETLRSTCEELLASQSEHERLLDALLTLASSERGLERREPVDLAAVTERVLRGPRPGVERLSLRIDATLAPAPAVGDPALLERLVANLIDNAVDHNVPGGRVAIHTDSEPNGASLTVSNTGARIAPDEIDGLFEPFRRLDADRTGGGGHAGLGLSIVRAIATAHHASLVARSQPEGGLTVTVRFPRPGAATNGG